MRAFLFLLPLAAHAAAQPCDPKCDPKAKAKATATVVSCDPVQGAQTVRLTKPANRAGAAATAVVVAPAEAAVSCDPIAAPAVVSTTSSGGVAVCAPSSSGGLVAVGQGSACSPATVSVQGSIYAPKSLGAQGSCADTTQPGAVTVVAQPAQSHGLFQARKSEMDAFARKRDAYTADALKLDEETRESIREAVEEAREAQREALEGAREAQREAAEEVREALREAREAQTEALREAEADVAEQLRAFQSSNGQMFQDGQIQALTRDALEAAQKAMADVDWEQFQHLPFAGYAALAEAQGQGGGGLENRIRALERLAREQGHATKTDGSLEDRVEALERALGARRLVDKRSTERALQLYGLEGKKGQSAKVVRPPKAPKGSKGMRAYSVDEDGKLRELAVPLAPLPRMSVPDAPSPAPAPEPPSAPNTWRSRTPPPAGAWLRTAPDAADREEIEQAMKKLRDEAESLRTEVQRMREKLESLPKRDDDSAR